MHTVVAFNAHPDDEALLTGGTIAQLTSRGHRVVLVTATDGAAGLADASFAGDGGLGRHRLRELEASARALGAADVVDLGYADSGIGPEAPASGGERRPFIEVPVQEAAERLAGVLRREDAGLLLGYDESGGYGHRDHVHVHRVARRAAELTRTRLLEATAPREPIARALRLAARVYPFPADFRLEDWERAFTPRARITHRIDVRATWRAKREAMAAHASQTTGPDGSGGRNIGRTLRLPGPVFRLVLGREYFVDPSAQPGPLSTDLLEDAR